MRSARNVFLIGMMGAGKTTAGRLLARRLKRPFFDSDLEVERRCGRKGCNRPHVIPGRPGSEVARPPGGAGGARWVDRRQRVVAGHVEDDRHEKATAKVQQPAGEQKGTGEQGGGEPGGRGKPGD